MRKHWKLVLLISLGLSVSAVSTWWLASSDPLDDDPGEHPDDGCGQ